MEIPNYDTSDRAEVLFGAMGFGQPPDEIPTLLQPGVLGLAWGGVLNAIPAVCDAPPGPFSVNDFP